MITDQQVLYSLYSQEGRQALKPEIDLQLYSTCKYPGDPWFYLGYHCRNALPKDPIQVIVYIELQQRPRCLNTNKKFRNTKK